MTINYRDLLKKYINHVGLSEGVTFIQSPYLHAAETGLTQEEMAELEVLDAEAQDDLEVRFPANP